MTQGLNLGLPHHGHTLYHLSHQGIPDEPRQLIKKQRCYFTTKVHPVKDMVFPVVMYRCESWPIKKAECWKTDAFEPWCCRTLESPLDCKEIQPVHPKDQFWIFIGRTDAEAETPVLWPPDAKNWLIGRDSGVGKDWRQEEKGMTEDEMVGWHHWLNGHEYKQAPGIGDGEGSLACCSPWGHKESVTTERLDWTELSLSLLQEIFSTQGSNPGLLHCRCILYQLNHKGSPRILERLAYPFSGGWIFPTQELNPGLLHCRQILYQLSYQRKCML